MRAVRHPNSLFHWGTDGGEGRHGEGGESNRRRPPRRRIATAPRLKAAVRGVGQQRHVIGLTWVERDLGRSLRALLEGSGARAFSLPILVEECARKDLSADMVSHHPINTCNATCKRLGSLLRMTAHQASLHEEDFYAGSISGNPTNLLRCPSPPR